MSSKNFLESEKERSFVRAMLNQSRVNAGLVIGSAAAKYKTANAVNYSINGVHKNKSGTDDIVFTSGHATLNPNSDTAQRCKFLVSLDASGNFKTSQGTIVAAADTAELPAVPDDEAVVGSIEVETNAATPFVPGTTDLSDGNITDTYVDLAWVDDGPDSFSY